MSKPLPVRLLRYLLYLCAALLIALSILLWQAPGLTQRHLPGWLAKHYGLQLTLGKIEVALRAPSLTIGPTALLDEQQKPILAFEQLHLVPKLKESWQHKAILLEEAVLTRPTLDLVRLEDKKGEVRFNLTEALAPLLASIPASDPTQPVTEPLLVAITRVALAQGQIQYRDSRKNTSPGWVPPLTLGDLALQLPEFSTEATRSNPYRLSATLNKKSPLKAEGELDIMTGAGKGKISLDKLALAPFAPLWAPYLKVNLAKGDASAVLDYRLVQGKQGLGWQLSKGKLVLNNWQLKRPKGAEFARFNQLALTGIRLDGNKQSLDVDAASLKTPVISAVLDDKQQLDLADLLITQPPAKASKQQQTGKSKAAAPWRWQLKQARISGGNLKLTESSSGKPLARELTGLELTLGALGSATDQPSPLTLNSTLNQQSQLNFEGSLTPAPFALHGDIKQQGLPLAWAQPYLQDLLRIKVQDGLLTSHTKLALATDNKGALSRLEVTGGFDVDKLYVLDRADNQRLLQIERLQLSGLRYDGLSQQLKIGDILLRQPFARIEINEEGITNVQQLLLPRPGNKGTSGGPAPRILIDQMRTEQGNLRFADRSLSPEFVVDIASLAGQSRHISNIPGQRSELAFNGKVDRYAPVTIRGGTNLLIDDPVLDVAVAFTNLELTTFTPYSSTYAGYAIDKGQLSMKLNYKLQGNRLEGDNDITIKKLQLGEKIKSEQAKDLPLGLAIALLSDSSGVIKMNLKVKGDLDQPNFSLGNIFWDVLGNTLTKAITSPFSLLASLTGGTKDLDELPFLAGDPSLTPSQQTKLGKLAQALKERPKLSMNIRGKVNFNEERPILQRQKLERVLAKITGSPADLAQLEQDPPLQAALGEAYEAKFKEDLGDLADRLKLPKQSPALRAQAVLLLRDQQLITAKSLRNLAMRRAQNTKEFLVDTQGIAPERLFVLDSQVKETDKEAKVVLTLDN
ncbi:DUF748 domain-containing protein [Aeromonas lusitana]|uniref:DUF748 domain-containing protein n=1 Tax=Aeromonas lusitana TaxID=931529 RepID=A0A2M8HEC8_9GAMM|nr:DUF748 domain-containing protein [Aeromonas lusitana]PJC94861.1 hypothetical protein CUC44_02680 [Aeromonas lusitana]